jgi:hypothetical protein
MPQDCLTERHLLLFGTIIQWFARYERLMLEISATVAGSDYAAVMLLTRGLDFEGKRKALLDLLRHRSVPLDQYDRVCSYLKIPHGLMRLRNDITHSTWMSVRYSNWIQPDWILQPPRRVKARRNDSAVSGGDSVEDEDDKIGYAIEDLEEIARTLSANHANFLDYLHDVRLVPSLAAESDA